ncbi:MAG TPA: TonB-dependent receptor [Woeseiaceae bacterium]|nr:TonB-dependent receptor [Woeseiaceae bacterium]
MSLSVRLCFLAIAFFSFHDALAAWKGAPLRAYIGSLLEQGVRIIYSTDLVLADYRVLAEPTSPDPATALRQALSPYGLTAADGPGETLLVIIDDRARATVKISVVEAGGAWAVPSARVLIDGEPAGHTDRAGRLSVPGLAFGGHTLTAAAEGYVQSPAIPFKAERGAPAELTVALTRRPEPLTEIIVTSSLYSLRYDPPGSHVFLERELTTKLPDLGDEATRSLTRLPGATSGGISTRNHVRGGVKNEQLFLLDGLRLYEPYHMKDFHEVATIVDQSVISGIDFYSAGYPARYGDRMSGVVDISLRDPPDEMETQLGLSFFSTSALSLGRFGDDDRGDWMASVRRGNLDLLTDIVNPEYGSPRYSDLLLHVGWELGERSYLSSNALFSYDKISISEIDGSVHADAKYQNDVFWIKGETSWSSDLGSTTILSATEIDDSRQGMTDRPGLLEGTLEDRRRFRSLALKQDWDYSLSDAWILRTGFELKRLEAAYAYASELAIAPPFDRILDNQPFEAREIDISPRGSQYAVYAEARWQATDRLILDAGLRWDKQTYTTAEGDAQASPRLSLLYELGPRTKLRIGFGEFYQAQEINELQVTDGVTDFHGAQHARHIVAGLEHEFEGGVDLRLEFYEKRYRDLMPRYENIFDSLVLIPELQIDRARIDVDAAIAEGAEITLSAGRPENLYWWASYAWSRAEDIAGDTHIPRSWDQTHTLNAGLSWDWRSWTFSAAGLVHTGWPRSGLVTETLADAGGTSRPVITSVRRNRLRYGEFRSLDVRASRRFDVGQGELTAFLEVTNLFNQDNPCCTAYSVVTDDEGNLSIAREQGHWLPMVPSLGVVWRF